MIETMEITEATEENWQDLANNIILQAAKDYRRALKKLMEEPDHQEALAYKLEVERFFRSAWYSMLTKVDGERLLTKLKRDIQNSEENL